MGPTPSTFAVQLGRLIRGEIEPREFPWLEPEERKALASLALARMKAGKAREARAAFRVLVDLDPDQAVYHLMLGQAAALEEDVAAAFESFGQAIYLSTPHQRLKKIAAEAFLARGDLLLRLERIVEAKADLADAAQRMDNPVRRRSIEAFLAT